MNSNHVPVMLGYSVDKVSGMLYDLKSCHSVFK